MLLSIIFVLLILVSILVTVFIVFYKKRINDELLFYLYREDEFPLNIYFYNETMEDKNFSKLFTSVKIAVIKFNETFNFPFFVINRNIDVYPNILMIQIACGLHKGCLSKFDGTGGILAHATYPPFRKVCIDCKDIDYNPLYIVLMHEFGHTIGLTHSKNEKVPSVMNAYINKNLTGFTEYDIKRVKKMFKFLK